jgi:hypothetical protein
VLVNNFPNAKLNVILSSPRSTKLQHWNKFPQKILCAFPAHHIRTIYPVNRCYLGPLRSLPGVFSGYEWRRCLRVPTDILKKLVKYSWLVAWGLASDNNCYLSTLWHVDPLLGNDREISKYTTAVTSNGFANKSVSTTTIGYSKRGMVFFVRSVPKCYKQDSQMSGVREESWLIIDWVNLSVSELRISRCELLLWKAGSWDRG